MSNNNVCLNESYSTTRLLTKEKPKIVNNPEDKFESVLFLPVGENRKGEGGLRTKGFFKKSYEDKPLISIVTVVYNGEKYLEETIQSVINQTYDNVEYIIIDGGSTDKTVDIIKKYEDRIDYWVSEKDSGIYDAMNKGIDLVSGEWINFMNAGDSFYDKEIFVKLFNQKNLKNIDVLYGDVLYIIENNSVKINSKKIKSFYKGLPFCHQCVFVKTNLHKQFSFDLSFKLCSDFNFFYYLYKTNHIFKNSNKLIAKYLADGLSDSMNIEANLERWEIVGYKSFFINLYYIFIIPRVFLFNKIKLLIGKRMSNFIKTLKLKLR